MASGRDHGSMLKRGWERISRRKKRKSEELTRRRDSSQIEDLEIELARDAGNIPDTSTSNTTKRSLVHRGMDRIRRSFRESFRRRSSRDHNNLRNSQSPGAQPSSATNNASSQPGASSSNNASSNSRPQTGAISSTSSGKADLWQPDETAVREGTCSFNVKYLGGVEVFESRGMQVCEGALKLLRTQRRHPLKAILYVSGDGLRVVDQENNRGLIVDQTIEKVSFCAPDRNHDKGFAYICRDGTSRRWMCHGFHATKESGERLSHAVGCAFAVCLERKKKRDAEAVLAVQAAAGLIPPSQCSDKSSNAPATTSAGFTLSNNIKSTTTASNMTSNTSAISSNKSVSSSNGDQQPSTSFRRHIPITERLQDPQTAILSEPKPLQASSAATNLNITSKPRPMPNPLLFERQGSLRAPESSTAAAAAFRRQFSLRSYSADSPLRNQQQNFTTKNLSLSRNEPIIEGDEEPNWPENSVLTQFGTLPANVTASSTTSNDLSNDSNGPRSSSTVPSSLHNGTIENMRDQNAYNRNHNVRSWSAEQSPLRVVTNYNHVTSSSRNDTNDAVVCASAPLSWSDNLWLNNNNNNSGSMGGIGDNNNEFSVDQHHLPSTRSKADEWLEKTLQTSLSLGNSPAKQMHSYSASPISNDSLKIGPPPDHPPPPLPPNLSSDYHHSSTAIQQNSTTSNYQNQTPVKKFDSDFSHYELPPITESFLTPTTSHITTANNFLDSSLTNAQNIDVFGQPVFNPLPEQSSAMTNGSPMNANNRYVSPELSQMKARNEEGANGNRIEEDPFDVQWSQLSSAKADSTQQSFTNHNTTNPFYSHSSALTT